MLKGVSGESKLNDRFYTGDLHKVIGKPVIPSPETVHILAGCSRFVRSDYISGIMAVKWFC